MMMECVLSCNSMSMTRSDMKVDSLKFFVVVVNLLTEPSSDTTGYCRIKWRNGGFSSMVWVAVYVYGQFSQ